MNRDKQYITDFQIELWWSITCSECLRICVGIVLQNAMDVVGGMSSYC